MRLSTKQLLRIIFICWILSTLFLMYLWRGALAADASFSWLPNSEQDLAGYKIYYGPESRSYDTIIDAGLPQISNGRVEYTVPGVPDGLTYYAASAYDMEGLESDFSTEVQYDPIPSVVTGIQVFTVTVNGNTTATFSWQPNSETDLAGYKISWDVEDLPNDIWNPANTVDVGLPSTVEGKVSYTVDSFPVTGSYISIVAYDAANNESVYAPRVRVQPAPASPVDFKTININISVSVN